MIDGLRAQWREELFSSHAWKLDRFRPPASGALDGVWLEPWDDAPFGAYFKPTVRHRSDPVAAREKIAADLAFDLGFPTAPVLLCDSLDELTRNEVVKGLIGRKERLAAFVLQTMSTHHDSTQI